MTNSHRTARKASLIRRRVSEFIGSCVLGWAGTSVLPFSVVSVLFPPGSFCGSPPSPSVSGVSPKHQGGPAERDPRPVGEGHPPDRLTVDEGAVGGTQVHQHHLIIFDAQFGMVAGDAGV